MWSINNYGSRGLDVHGSMHHSTIHKEKSKRCNNVSKFYYSIFIWSSTCFGRHTAHHKEPKAALAASGFSHVVGCWTCSWWTLSGTVCLTTSTYYTSNNLPRCQAQCAWQRPPTTCLTTFHVWKTIGCQCSFRLLMMGGMSPETCWASYKYEIIKFWCIVASCWIFLYELKSRGICCWMIICISVRATWGGRWCGHTVAARHVVALIRSLPVWAGLRRQRVSGHPVVRLRLFIPRAG